MRRFTRAEFGAAAVLCALAVVGCPARASAGGFAGSDAIYPHTDKTAAGRARAFSQNPIAAGRISRLSVYLSRKSTASGVKLGLYSDARSRPGRRLAFCALTRPRGGRWNSCRVSPVIILRRTRYWAAVLQPRRSTGTLRFRDVRS